MANSIYETRRAQLYPTLSDAQLLRLRARGREQPVAAGEDLIRPGDRYGQLLVVLSGALEILSPSARGEEVLRVAASGEFVGEISTLRGTASHVHVRVRDSGTVLVVDAGALHDLFQTDAELSE